MKKEKMILRKLSLVASFVFSMSLFALHSSAQHTISGVILNDLNGIRDNQITGVAVNPSSDLKVVLYNNTSQSVAQVDNDLSDGYSFSNVITNNYTLYLTESPVTINQTAIPKKNFPPAGFMQAKLSAIRDMIPL